jgi:hypothetical protein
LGNSGHFVCSGYFYLELVESIRGGSEERITSSFEVVEVTEDGTSAFIEFYNIN